jgi:hypothetical protein
MTFYSLRRFPFLRLALAIFVGWLWYRSHRHTDVLALFLHDGKAQVLVCDRGRAVLLATNISFGSARAYTYDFTTGSNDDFADVRQALYETPPVPEYLAGVLLGRRTGEILLNLPNEHYRMISVPFWQLAIVGGLPLLLGLRTFWKRRAWGTKGHCAACGYDVRFSSCRCPECGLELPAA